MTKLTHSLGPWTRDYKSDVNWTWTVCPMMYNLYHQQTLAWMLYRPTTLKYMYIQYNDPPEPTNSPDHVLPPVTPNILNEGIQIQLPITPLPQDPVVSICKHPMLIQSLTTPSESWESSLWYKVRPHMNLYTLIKTLQQGRTVFIVSDASVNHCGHATMAWIIHSKSKLWSGEGIVPGPIHDMYSGLAKAYGVLTALSFLQNYANKFLQTISEKSQVYICCDNLGVITRVNNETNHIATSNQALQDEYGVYLSIKQIANAIPTVTLCFLHILGHQDTRNKKKPLTLEARLNIECNVAATKLHSQLTPNQYPQQHPLIWCAQLYLFIQDQHIIRHTQQNLQDAHSTIEYAKYVTKKYKCSNTTYKHIAWPVLRIAINWFPANKQQIIQKFIHGWLPLQTCPQVTSTSRDKLCLSCKCHPEDMAHFLSCNHSTRMHMLQPLQLQIQKLHQKHDVHPQLYQLLWQGLMSTLLVHELSQPEEQYQGIYLQIHKWPECIGWEQLLYGWFDNLWIQAIEAQTVNGVNFYAKVTQLCWQHVIKVWTEQNWALHDTTNPYNTSHLWATIQKIFHDAAQHPDTQSTICNQMVKLIMNWPLSQINSWVEYGAMHLRDHA